MTRLWIVAFVFLLPWRAALAQDFGEAVPAKQASREIRVGMRDAMRFSPAEIALKRGESVRFVVHNSGKVMHEMVLGTIEQLKAHAEVMRRHPHMQHEDDNMIHVRPGRTGRFGWRFTRAGEYYYACLIPGHFEAGMIGRITVKE